jgi:hypothetical protein
MPSACHWEPVDVSASVHVGERLELSRSVFQAAKPHLDLSGLQLYLTLPHDAPEERRRDLEADWYGDRGGSQTLLVEWIQRQLAVAEPYSLCLFEHYYCRRSHDAAKMLTTRVRFFGDDIYHLVFPDESPAFVRETLENVEDIRHLLGILVQLPSEDLYHEAKENNEFSEPLVLAMVTNIRAVICDAQDNMAYAVAAPPEVFGLDE